MSVEQPMGAYTVWTPGSSVRTGSACLRRFREIDVSVLGNRHLAQDEARNLGAVKMLMALFLLQVQFALWITWPASVGRTEGVFHIVARKGRTGRQTR